MDYYFTYQTDFGVGAVIGDDFGIKYHLLPETIEAKLFKRLRELTSGVQQENAGLKSSLEAYFRGAGAVLPVELNLGGYSAFAKKVYNSAVAIGYNQTTTYRRLADLAGCPRGQRAVGNALNKNRLPVFIPCHRVIKADGSRGGWGGKPGWKEKLLNLEAR